MKILGIYIGEIIVFIVFQYLIYYCWGKIILYLKQKEKKHLQLAKGFLIAQIVSTILIIWIALIDCTFGSPFPLYIFTSIILLFYPVRIIKPLRNKILELISAKFK
jgi:hypothetical protein